MRSFLRGLGVLAASFMFALAAAAQPVTLTRGNVAEPGTIDPQKYLATYEAEIIRDLFLGLVTLDANAQVIPGLAESWTVSEDGLVYTFTLREGLVWSDGVALTAEDAVAGLRRAMDPKTAAVYANFGYKMKNGRAVNEGALPPDALGARAVDARTVEIELEAPSLVWLRLLAGQCLFFPIPRHVLEAAGDTWTQAGTMVTSGPYMLAEWKPQEHVKLVKNPTFFDAASVQIDEVYFLPTDDDPAAVKMFREGSLDLNTRYPAGERAALLEILPEESVLANPASWINYLVLNQTRPPFSDGRVRRALSLAIDRDTITKVVLGEGELAATTYVPATLSDFVSSGAGGLTDATYEARRETARALLAEAGFGPDNPLRFTLLHRIGAANSKVVLAIQEQWAAIGVAAELQPNEVKTHYDRLRAGDFEVADAGWSGAPDPEFFIYLLETDSTEINFGRWSNAEYDRLAKAGQRERDPAKRLGYFREAERIALEDTALIPLFVPVERSLVQTWVTGYAMNAQGIHPTRFLRKEKND
jgi:oligopeptide transport system substrate-binding protein